MKISVDIFHNMCNYTLRNNEMKGDENENLICNNKLATLVGLLICSKHKQNVLLGFMANRSSN